MKILALALLAVGCAGAATAAPAPAPSPPAPAPAPAPARRPPPKGCVARGTPMFEIDHKADPGAKLATSAFKLYESGAWTFQSTDAEGKPGDELRGCLAGPEVAAVRKELEVPWKVTTARFHCMAYSAAFTEYSVRGKPVFTARMCSGTSLDEASQKALTDLEARAKTVTGASL